jgi:hypothetical protein
MEEAHDQKTRSKIIRRQKGRGSFRPCGSGTLAEEWRYIVDHENFAAWQSTQDTVIMI